MYTVVWAWNDFSFTIALVAGALLVGCHTLKRRRFILRSVICCLILAGFVFGWRALLNYVSAFPLGEWRTVLSLAKFFIQYILVIFGMWFCFDFDFWAALFCGTAAYSMQHMTQRAYAVLELILGLKNEQVLERSVLLTIITLAGYAAIYFGAIRKNKYFFSNIAVDHKMQIIASACFISIAIVLNSRISGLASRNELTEIKIYNFAMSSISALIALMLQFSIFSAKKSQSDVINLQRMLYEKSEQYKLEKENIEQINIKIHDLRHQIGVLDTKLDKRELKEIIQATDIYGSFIKTGNDAIDTVLTQKILYCQKRDIRLTCIMNGKGFGHIPAHELYALFGNAIENAVEAVEKLDSEKRIISVTEARSGSFSKIRIANYYDGIIHFSRGLPVTQKNINYHGFGMKSIKLLTEKHGGRMDAQTHGELFILEIFLPLKEAS